MTEPHEALLLPELPDTEPLRRALNDLLTAVNGFPYPGDRADALALGVRWMRANPDLADALLGREAGDTARLRAVSADVSKRLHERAEHACFDDHQAMVELARELRAAVQLWPPS